MAGVFSKLREMLSTTVRIRPPEGAQRVCNNCALWVQPTALTQAMTRTQSALDWAKQGGYGACRAPREAGDADDKEGQRFTLPSARCKHWNWHGKAWDPLPAAPGRAAKPGSRRN